MPRYDYWCEACGQTTEYKFPAPPPSTTLCNRCNWPEAQRVYSVPVIAVPEMNAQDVLNRHYRGEGDPVPGMTQAQTMQAARAKYVAEKKAKALKSNKGYPTISTPATPGAHRYYGPD